MPLDKDFSDLIALLYAAPLTPANWRVFLGELCRHTGAPSAGLVTIARSGASHVDADFGVSQDSRAMKAYNLHFHAQDPYARALLRNGNVGVVAGSSWVPDRELKRTEFYTDFMLPNRLGAPTVATFTAEADRLEVLMLGNDPQQAEPAGATRQRALQPLLTHLHAAYNLRAALLRGAARANRAEQTLDRLASAVFLLSARSEVLYLNVMAAELVQHQDAIVTVRSGRLKVRDARVQLQLEIMIAQVGQAAAAQRAQAGGILLVPRRGQLALQVRVFPLRPGATGESACVLVVMSDPERTTIPPHALLQQLYGLTAREAEIARQLALGMSPENIAEEREVSIGTVRVQIKQLLHKAGVRRQTDLIRLLLAFPRVVGDGAAASDAPPAAHPEE